MKTKAQDTFLAVFFGISCLILTIRGDPSWFTGLGVFMSMITSAYFTARLWLD